MSNVELNDEIIWKKISSYPPFIHRGFEKLKETSQQYLTSGFSDQIRNQSQFDEVFLQEFCYFFSRTQSLEKTFARAGGIVYGFGFEWGKLKILQYYRKHLKNPTPERNIFYFFKRDCKMGILKYYGVSSWLDLLEVSLKDHTYFRQDRRNFTGQNGLHRAKAFLQNQYQINGKLPLSSDNGCKLIAKAIRRNIWEDFGIVTWGDLIYEIFGLIKGTMYLWKGGGGFDRAISWIKAYFTENGNLPSGTNSVHYNSIKDLVNSKFWIKYGINTMDDLTLKACGMVSKKKNKHWTGIEGLERAKNELKKYFHNHQKLPISSKFHSILHVILKEYWKEFNIGSWNELLMATFGKINQVHRSWKGQAGLNRAKKALCDYRNKYKRCPKQNSQGEIKSISRALIGKYWIEFGIFTWDDLIQHTFNETQSSI